jgi:hypothetical protein
MNGDGGRNIVYEPRKRPKTRGRENRSIIECRLSQTTTFRELGNGSYPLSNFTTARWCCAGGQTAAGGSGELEKGRFRGRRRRGVRSGQGPPPAEDFSRYRVHER